MSIRDTLATDARVALHMLWRVKTRAWTQAWGGWDDVDTA